MNGVLGYAGELLQTGDPDAVHRHPPLDWEGESSQVHANLTSLDAQLQAGKARSAGRLERLLQGPLSNAMTHVGQLATLRRVNGSPVRAENFYKAAIKAGQLGPVQAPTVSPD